MTTLIKHNSSKKDKAGRWTKAECSIF